MKKNLFHKYLSLLLAVFMVISILPARNISAADNITSEAVTATDAEVSELLSSIAKSYKNTYDYWAAMDMAAYGMADDVAGKTIVENARSVYASGSLTDIARSIITLTSLGVNASNVYSGSESIYLDFIEKLGKMIPSQIMEAIFGLNALDSGEYNDNGMFTRQSCIDFLLDKKMEPAAGQYAWIIWGDSPDVDTTAMAVAALAPYYNTNEGVKTAVDGALKYLSEKQNNLGNYENSNSTSMVIVAITAMGKDPSIKTGDFAKGGKSLIDGLLEFRTSSNQFGWGDNITATPLSTEQGFRALVAYTGYLYSGSNAYNIYYFGPQTGDGTELTGESDPGVIPPDPNAPKNINVRIENLYNGTALMPETVVKLSGTHLDALKAALVARGKNPETDLSESGGYVSTILGVSGDSTTGWMYAVNGEIPVTSLSETQIAEGDNLVMFFIDWYDTCYLTKFDKTIANIKAGESIILQLTGMDTFDAMMGSGAYAPVTGAAIFARDASFKQVETEVVTDEDGKAMLTFQTAGTYTVSAKRKGAINATDLVPPACAVTVTSSSTPGPDPVNKITVYFTLRGLNKNDTEETWINKKVVDNIEEDAVASEVIIKALNNSGYTQKGAEDGYIESITAPNGFTLSEKHNGMENSGWLYKVNSKLPNVSVDMYKVKNNDHIELFFTKDYIKDPDAGTISTVTDKPKTDAVIGIVIDKEKIKSFDDVDDSIVWAKDAIEILAGNGIIDGTGTNFEPQRLITRAEFTKIIVKALNLEVKEAAGSVFIDVNKTEWFADFVECGYQNNIITGYPDGSFKPNDVISRNEIAVILSRIIDISRNLKNNDLKFTDKQDIPEWALNGVKYAAEENLMKGYEDNSFRGLQPITRAEAAVVIYRYLTKID